MNEKLVYNWNEVVNKNDVVYFVGDFLFKNSVIEYWISALNGQKIFIEGNHDVVKNEEGQIIHHKIEGAVHDTILNYRGYEFYLIHDPQEIPDHWKSPDRQKSWVIHGHEHNNDITKYPFIEGENKRINVSVELIEYTPLDVNKLINLDLSTIKRMDTIGSQPLRNGET